MISIPRVCRHKVIACLIAPLLVLAGAGGGAAQALPVVVLKMTVGKLIAQAHQAGDELLNQAQNHGTYLEATAGNQLDVAASDAALALQGVMDREIGQLKPDLQTAAGQLYFLTQQVQALNKNAFDLERAITLDLRAYTQFLPFVGETFYIQQIEGIGQFKHNADYKLAVFGVGLGPASEKSESIVNLSIDGKVLGNARVEQTRANEADIYVPSSVMDRYFSPTKIVLVPVTLATTRRTHVMLPVPHWREKTYQTPFHVELFPDSIGVITVSYDTRTVGWVGKGHEQAAQRAPNMDCNTVDDDDCHHPKSAQTTLDLHVAGNHAPVIGDRRLDGAQMVCSDGPCPWTKVNAITYSEGNTRVIGTAENWSGPVTWTLTADVSEWAVTGTQHHDVVMPMVIDKNLTISVPLEEEFIAIRGATVWGRSINLVPPQSDGPLHFISTTDTSVDRKFVFQIDRPTP